MHVCKWCIRGHEHSLLKTHTHTRMYANIVQMVRHTQKHIVNTHTEDTHRVSHKRAHTGRDCRPAPLL